jgi:hypothetical protein
MNKIIEIITYPTITAIVNAYWIIHMIAHLVRFIKSKSKPSDKVALIGLKGEITVTKRNSELLVVHIFYEDGEFKAIVDDDYEVTFKNDSPVDEPSN